MRLLKETFEKDGSGSVTLMPEDPEDMWSAYNLIRAGDLVRASAIRRVTTESSTGTTSSHRVHTTLTVRVKSTTFDIQAGQLHVGGEITEETAVAHVGQHHTLDLELNRQFSIDKTEGWDSVSIGIVREACAPGKGATAWAVIMDDTQANIAVLLGERTVLRQRVANGGVRGKGRRTGEKYGSKAGGTYFQTILTTLLRHADLSQSLPILLCSPGYTAASFKQHILDTAIRTSNKPLQSQKSNLITVHSSSGQYHALSEVLSSPSVTTLLSDTRYARESALLDRFMALLRQDQGRAWYGPREVEAAVEMGAVGRGGGVLLVSNGLFRAQDVEVRRRWVKLVDRVRDVEGGEARILSSEHESGKRLEALGGIAAILTFPVADVEVDDEEEGGS